MSDGRLFVGAALLGLLGAKAAVGSRGVVRSGQRSTLRETLTAEILSWIDALERSPFGRNHPTDVIDSMRRIVDGLDRRQPFDPWQIGQLIMGTWIPRLESNYNYKSRAPEMIQAMWKRGRDLEQRTMDEGSRGVVRTGRSGPGAAPVYTLLEVPYHYIGREGDPKQTAFLILDIDGCPVRNDQGVVYANQRQSDAEINRLRLQRGEALPGPEMPSTEKSKDFWERRNAHYDAAAYRARRGSRGAVRAGRAALRAEAGLRFVDAPNGMFALDLTDDIATTRGLWFRYDEDQGWYSHVIDGTLANEPGSQRPAFNGTDPVRFHFSHKGPSGIGGWKYVEGHPLSKEAFLRGIDQASGEAVRDWMTRGSRGVIRAPRKTEPPVVYVIAEQILKGEGSEFEEGMTDPLFWNNEGGFEDLDSAARYSEEERERVTLPFNGVWEDEKVARQRLERWNRIMRLPWP